MKLAALLILGLMLTAAKAFAQAGAPLTPAASPVPLPSPVETRKNAAPPLKNLRYDENFSFLRDASKRTDWLDKLKYISLTHSENWYLTLGGEVRLRYETYRNNGFGAGVQDANGYLLERYMLHADFHFGKRFRVFGQVKSGLIEDRNGGARPTDLDKFDFNQLFADIKLFENKRVSASVRVGRQEIELGSSRFVSVREGANVRQSFDGVQLFVNVGKWQFSPTVFKPVTTRRGVFDDQTNSQQTFYGGYAARSMPKKFKGIFVIFANELDSKRLRYEQGIGRESRQTLGARIAGKTGSFDFNYEAAAQFGKFADADIRAWAIITDSGYSFPKVRFKPRFAVRFDATSGDKNSRDAKLQTFNPLFASANAYSGLVSLLLPSNSTAFVPLLELNLSKKVAVKFDNALFWRTSDRDGIYGSIEAQRGGQASCARFAGNQPSAQIVWRISRYLSATTVYTHFFAGRFLRETPPAKDLDYLTSYLTFKF